MKWISLIRCLRFCSSLRQQKWNYTEEEITSIVNHMQKLSLLNNPSSQSEQAEYLKTAMKIAEKLTEVEDTDITPFHNPAQFMTTSGNGQDDANRMDSEFLNRTFKSDLKAAPSIKRN